MAVHAARFAVHLARLKNSVRNNLTGEYMETIQRPVQAWSSNDAFYIVDAAGKVIADCIQRKEWAEEIAKALNGEKK